MTEEQSIELRVWVTDTRTWDNIRLPAQLGQNMGEIKRASLTKAMVGGFDPTEFEVKFRGALVIDESRTLASLDVADGAPLIVQPSLRRPAR